MLRDRGHYEWVFAVLKATFQVNQLVPGCPFFNAMIRIIAEIRDEAKQSLDLITNLTTKTNRTLPCCEFDPLMPAMAPIFASDPDAFCQFTWPLSRDSRSSEARPAV
jgi:hypothetical protein